MSLFDNTLLYVDNPDADKNETKNDISETENNIDSRNESGNKSIASEDNISNQLKIFTQHLYDDVFSYIFSEQTKLFLPLINEAFHTNYSNDTSIKVEANNFMPYRQKRIADALVSIGNNLYHFECESKNSEIIIRLEEYDDLIIDRFKDKSLFTAVIYIRNSKLPNSNILDNGRTIPYIKVQDYSMQELLDKQLYILLPYYVMRYENKIKNNSDSEYKTIVSDLKCLYNEIEKLNGNELLSNNDFSDALCKMCVEITLRISKNSTFADYLRKEGAMPMSWMTYEEEIQQAKRETLTTKEKTEIQAIQSLMDKLQKNYEDACEILGYNKEKYRLQFKI